jgi:type I restriction enzyme R subunit
MINQNPEQQARDTIDAKLRQSGWVVQKHGNHNIAAGLGVAVCEFPMAAGHGFADYLLYVDKKVVGVIEAKKEGTTLTGVEVQTEKYSVGLPGAVPAIANPLPFLYQSSGVETFFTNTLEPNAQAREVFTFHRPETLKDWAKHRYPAPGSPLMLAEKPATEYIPETVKARLQNLPALHEEGMRACQVQAITNLERSLAQGRRRSLVQMQTGSGKTFTAVAQSYRLIKFAQARRVLFLVDRSNLARQTLGEFQQYVTPDDGRKFTELYNVQHLKSNKIDPAAKVVITTIQRLYSILKGEEEFDESLEEAPDRQGIEALIKEPLPVVYNPNIPVEEFDFVFTDECHRSIYNLWRQVLEYFDCQLIGLTATPSKQTLGFFHQNLVMEYGHAQAVADKVNVDFDVYRIRTRVTEQGIEVEANTQVQFRDRKSRRRRWGATDEDATYRPNQLDRAITVPDQIRTIIRAFRDRTLPECFPDRTHVPKTLIFAKDDSHAEDIVRIVREEFAKENQFCEKITYQTGTARIVDPATGNITYQSTNLTPESLLSSFKNSYYPRIAVTVDMIATGTDVKPLEIVFFMRDVKSANYFEQMKGRGCRVLSTTEFQNVTPDAREKLRYVLVDAVGVTEHEFSDSPPLERQPTVPLKTILGAVANGNCDVEVVSTLAGRLARLDRLMAPGVRSQIESILAVPFSEVVRGLVRAVDPDVIAEATTAQTQLTDEDSPEFVYAAGVIAAQMREAAVQPLFNAELRNLLLRAQEDLEMIVHEGATDEILEAAASAEATEKARNTITSFREFLEQNRDEITALQMLYTRRRGQSPTLRDLKTLAETIQAPPRSWTTEGLWQAYEMLERSKVKGRGGKLPTDIVSLVRFALEQETVLAPFRETVEDRFAAWMASQTAAGTVFTPEQQQWLIMMKDHIAASMQIERGDLENAPFTTEGGLGAAWKVFGDRLDEVIRELNEVLVA